MANEKERWQQAHENVLIARRRLTRMEERSRKPDPAAKGDQTKPRTPTAEEKQQIEDAKSKLALAENAELKARLALHRSLT